LQQPMRTRSLENRHSLGAHFELFAQWKIDGGPMLLKQSEGCGRKPQQNPIWECSRRFGRHDSFPIGARAHWVSQPPAPDVGQQAMPSARPRVAAAFARID
jgi:hypothetical protein